MGSGVWGWPVPEAAGLITRAVAEWAAGPGSKPGAALKKVVLVDLSRDAAEAFSMALMAMSAGTLPPSYLEGAGGAAVPEPPTVTVTQSQWAWQEDNKKMIPYDKDQNK